MTRRLVTAVATTAALVATPAAGHPGHGPGSVTIAGNEYKPGKLTVARGDTVIWFWDGPDTNHSVTSRPGQRESFDSDPDVAPAFVRHDEGDAYSYDFSELGSYSYFCKVHPDAMRGTIEVIKPPPVDTRPPRMSKLNVEGRRVSFRLSERAFVVLSIRRKGRKREGAARFLRRGKRSIRFRRKGLAAGRYKAALVAEDDVGNRSRSAVRFRIA